MQHFEVADIWMLQKLNFARFLQEIANNRNSFDLLGEFFYCCLAS